VIGIAELSILDPMIAAGLQISPRTLALSPDSGRGDLCGRDCRDRPSQSADYWLTQVDGRDGGSRGMRRGGVDAGSPGLAVFECRFWKIGFQQDRWSDGKSLGRTVSAGN
jgi:hypothetical protein